MKTPLRIKRMSQTYPSKVKRQYVSAKPLIAHFQESSPISWKRLFQNKHPLEVEIGSGLGEYLVRLGAADPKKNFVGIEQDCERVHKTLRSLSEQSKQINNVRVIAADVWIILQRHFKSKSISKIHCLFPCPWPKRKHEKHRLFSTDFFYLLSNRLKDGGCIKFVTDSLPYFNWVVEQMPTELFSSKIKKIKPQYDTKFERRWEASGQNVFYELQLLKEKHKRVVIKKDVPLRVFSVKIFDEKKFKVKDVKGQPSIIFKDLIFDSSKKKGIIEAIVSEEHLMQYVSILITRGKKNWQIYCLNNNQIFPTEGVAKALELVYNAAK